ncbi:hypothetical protein GCM10025784_22070 [Citricoccus nitrophenolicus]
MQTMVGKNWGPGTESPITFMVAVSMASQVARPATSSGMISSLRPAQNPEDEVPEVPDDGRGGSAVPLAGAAPEAGVMVCCSFTVRVLPRCLRYG